MGRATRWGWIWRSSGELVSLRLQARGEECAFGRMEPISPAIKPRQKWGTRFAVAASGLMILR